MFTLFARFQRHDFKNVDSPGAWESLGPCKIYSFSPIFGQFTHEVEGHFGHSTTVVLATKKRQNSLDMEVNQRLFWSRKSVKFIHLKAI